jgi:hypothetical protein
MIGFKLGIPELLVLILLFGGLLDSLLTAGVILWKWTSEASSHF